MNAKNKLIAIAVAYMVGSLISGTLSAKDFYVAENGDDGYEGTKLRPFSIERAFWRCNGNMICPRPGDKVII